MKLAFIGAHGVGKTTLCFDLASRLKRLDLGVDIVKEVARSCPLPINRATTIEAQAWILHTQIAQEIAAVSRDQMVICDRSVLDNYAYLVHRAGRRPEFDALVGAWVTTYDALFKVPVLHPPAFDGQRDVSAEFQTAINDTIDDLIKTFGVSCHFLDPIDRDGWVDDALAAAGLPLKPPQIDLFSRAAQ
jgi:GTPase SAR1 family protein